MANENGKNENEIADDVITEPEYMRKLFVGGLDYRTTDEGLKSHFEKWGNIVDVVVMKGPRSKRSRGFGFVTYSRSSMIDAAQNARPHKIDGRTVEPKRAIPRQDIDGPNAGASIKKLFVGGIRDIHDENSLRDYFGSYGRIVDVNIITEKDTGKKRGFAFVEFDDYDPVDKIVLQKHHTINDKQMEVKKALPKQDKNDIRGGNRGNINNGGGSSNFGTNNGNNWANNQNDFFGGNGGGTGSGGLGNWSNNSNGSWENTGAGIGGGNWNYSNDIGSGSYSGGPNSNNVPTNSGNWGNSFGDGYQQNYGGGPQRVGGLGNFGNNRPQPYSNSGNFGNSKSSSGFDRARNFGGNNHSSKFGAFGVGGMNRRY